MNQYSLFANSGARPACRFDPSESQTVAGRRVEAEQRAASVADLSRPAQGSGGLTLRRLVAGIAYVDREARKKLQSADEGTQRRIMRHQQGQQVAQDVRPRNGLTKFF